MTTSIRSLADLRDLIPEPPRREGPYIPIPCSRCGRSLDYWEAVATVTPEWSGYTHERGTCDPRHVAEHASRLSLKGPNGNREEREQRSGPRFGRGAWS